MYVIIARTDPDAPGFSALTFFIVDAGTKGLVVGRSLEKIGFHASDTAEIFLDGVKVHKSKILGELNKGFVHAMMELPRERAVIGVQCLGLIEGALEWTVDYVKKRHAFGGPLSKLQNTRFRIADMQTEYRLNRAFINECIDKFNAGQLDAPTASMA